MEIMRRNVGLSIFFHKTLYVDIVNINLPLIVKVAISKKKITKPLELS